MLMRNDWIRATRTERSTMWLRASSFELCGICSACDQRKGLQTESNHMTNDSINHAYRRKPHKSFEHLKSEECHWLAICCTYCYALMCWEGDMSWLYMDRTVETLILRSSETLIFMSFLWLVLIWICNKDITLLSSVSHCSNYQT